MAKLLIVVETGDPNLILVPGLICKATLSEENKNNNQVRIILIGPSEKLISENENLMKDYSQMASEKPVACAYMADILNVDKDLLSKYFRVDYIADYLAKSIDEGFEIVTF
ncbi:MAG: hypothetical protein ACP5RP_04365 [Candidatus Micrarchaeia archaeon]